MTGQTQTPSSQSTTPTPAKKSPNAREVVASTAADILVVCCCCPCGLLECLILTVYKVPANLVRRIWSKQRQKLMIKRRRKKGLLEGSQSQGSGVGMVQREGFEREMSDVDVKELEKGQLSVDRSLDRKMWDQFDNSGFWRSTSQRHTSS